MLGKVFVVFVVGTLQLLDSDHVRGRDKALLRSILVGGVWNGFLLHKIKGQRVPCRFCGSTDRDGHLVFGENVLFHVKLRFVNTLSFMISWRWISRLGLVACFGMVGCLFFPGSMVVLLGLRALGRVLLIFLSALLDGILLMCSRSGSCRLVLMLLLLLGGSLLSLMSGLMGAWWWTRSLVLPLLVRVVLFIAAVIFGQIGGGVIWRRMLVRMPLLAPVVAFVQFLVPCNLFRGLSSGCYSCFAGVNHDGVACTSLDPVIWSVGGATKRRRVVHAIRDGAFLPGPAGVWDGEWDVVAATQITCHDIELWPYSFSMLVKWVAFLYTLHWPQGGADLGVGGVSYVELLIFYVLLAGERLVLEKAVLRYRRAGRSISV